MKVEKTNRRLYSISESAKYLGISTWSIREMVHRGELSLVRLGRRTLVDVFDLDKLVETNKSRET